MLIKTSAIRIYKVAPAISILHVKPGKIIHVIFIETTTPYRHCRAPPYRAAPGMHVAARAALFSI